MAWAALVSAGKHESRTLSRGLSATRKHFKEMDGLFSKCWWCNQEKGEWGALYIFNSDADLQAYITSERWLKVVPEKYGCKPEIQAILDPGPILCNAAVTEGEDSWMTASESSERR